MQPDPLVTARSYGSAAEMMKSAKSIRRSLMGKATRHATAKPRDIVLMAVTGRSGRIELVAAATPLWARSLTNFDDHVERWRANAIIVALSGSKTSQAYVQRRSLELGFRCDDIVGTSRERKLCKARQIIIWEMVMQLGKSLSEIGRIFERDHTTILHAVNKIERMKQAEISACGGEIAGFRSTPS